MRFSRVHFVSIFLVVVLCSCSCGVRHSEDMLNRFCVPLWSIDVVLQTRNDPLRLSNPQTIDDYLHKYGLLGLLRGLRDNRNLDVVSLEVGQEPGDPPANLRELEAAKRNGLLVSEFFYQYCTYGHSPIIEGLNVPPLESNAKRVDRLEAVRVLASLVEKRIVSER